MTESMPTTFKVNGNYQDIAEQARVVATCPNCKEVIGAEGAKFCPSCGFQLMALLPMQATKQSDGAIYVTRHGKHKLAPRKIDRISTGVLALVLGTFGVHWFYLGKPGLGVLCLLTFWTGIPLLGGIIYGIICLVSDDEKFKTKLIW
ncbi:MAG TPA: TM2 domain-containing protein [Candidatus Lokiarchaeia archaeon]|nr:TM2 domain-containing protein [Candidatus Lokiarchaeia archaeon]